MGPSEQGNGETLDSPYEAESKLQCRSSQCFGGSYEYHEP